MFHQRGGRGWYGVLRLLSQNERSARHVSLKAYYWEAPLIRGNWRDDGEARECLNKTFDKLKPLKPLSVVTCACAVP